MGEAQVKQSIAQKKEELGVAADRKCRVDEILAPLLQEMQNLESRKHRAESSKPDLESRKRRAESDLVAAQDFEQLLSSANGDESESRNKRRIIHEECKRRFDEGSPGSIIRERQKEIRQMENDIRHFEREVQQSERDLDKAKRRVEDIAAKAARKIDTIVIDGNNLCYEGSTFIGLSAIDTLLPLLSRICAVVIVFDSAIRRLLNVDDSGLQKRLGNHAKVHVVVSSRMADETVLDLASASELTYVLSNDRFEDFNEKSPVKDGRIIRHEIVNGYVFVHDLQVRAAYG